MGNKIAQRAHNFATRKENRIMTNLRTISKSDNIFITLIAAGRTIKTIVSRNFSNLNEVIKMASMGCGNHRGLVQLGVRNQSQGWNLNMLLRVGGDELPARLNNEIEPPRDGLQYRLAF